MTPTARRSQSGTPLTFPNSTNAMMDPSEVTNTNCVLDPRGNKFYRVYVLIDGQQLCSTLLVATSKAAAIAKAQQEPVTIRTTGRITYTASPITA
jgi:hypothetical protein